MNLAPQDFQEWLATDESKSVGDTDSGESTGHKSGRRIVEIKRTNEADISDDKWDQMATVVGCIKRHLSQGGPKTEKENSPQRYSLVNWGHDPLKDQC